MKAIMISDHAKWCALMMNGKKTIEVRTGTALYKATQKLIDENGYAEFYVYCSKGKPKLVKSKVRNKYLTAYPKLNYEQRDYQILNGKVIFKFRCYKVEKLYIKYRVGWNTNTIKDILTIEEKTCVSRFALFDYLGSKGGYAIYISDLEIFDKPKELSEFYKVGVKEEYEHIMSIDERQAKPYIDEFYRLTKAPQSFCYIEAE